MAAVDINTTLKRWESGGSVAINDGTDDLTVFNVASGSLEWTSAMPSRIKYKDRGQVKMPIEGDNNYGSAKLTIQAGAYVSGLLDRLADRNAAGNTAKPFGLLIKVPAYQGAATGESITWAAGQVFLDGDATVKHGGPDALDTIEFTFGTLSNPAFAAY